MTEYVSRLYWDSTYAITLALMEHYPDADPELIGLEELAGMVQTLPGFDDEPAAATTRMLLDIQLVWYEEATNR